MIKVFLSYSRKDDKAREICETCLKPLQREGLVELWIDTTLEPGDLWDQEIDAGLQASDAAVLLVTKNFHASNYIAEKELPVLLRKMHADDTRILPVFLERCSDREYRYRDPNYNWRKKRVGAFQGIGSPTEPLDALTPSAQNECWTALVDKLDKLAKQSPKRYSEPKESHPAAPKPKEPPKLFVTLEIQGDRLLRSYRGENLRQPGTDADWADWRQRLAPLLDWSADPDPARFATDADGWSELLFQLLFATGPARDELFRNGHGRGAEIPSYQPYEVLVETAHPDLLRLPWQLCDWRGLLRNRGGWCFCTSGGGDPVSAGLNQPLRALLVQPDRSGEGPLAELRRRLQELQELPAGTEERLFPLVYLEDGGAADAFRNREIDLLLYRGPGFPADPGQAGLPELAEALLRSGRRFRLIALLLTGSRNPGAPSSPTGLVAEYGDFVSVEYAPPEGTADLYTPQWLNHWLRERCSPLRAWAQVLDREVKVSPAAAAVGLHARPVHWHFTGPARDLGIELWKLFDRTDLKTSLQAELGDLSSPDSSLKVLALCPFGTEGDHASRFSTQLQHHLEDHLADLPLIPVNPLGFPFDRRNLAAGLDRQLRHHLGSCGGGDRIGDCIERLVPPSARDRGRRPVVWLDWGTFGATPGLQRALTGGELKGWLSYCAERLVAYCPPDTLLVSVLSIETESVQELTGFFRRVYNSAMAHGNRFRLHEPKALERIMVAHVLRLFADRPGLISEDWKLRQEVAEYIVERAGGLFEKAVRLLERGRDYGWETLLRESPGYADAAPEDDWKL